MNATKSDGSTFDFSCFILSNPSDCHLNASEWVLDMGAAYHICLRREMFASFGKLDGGVMLFGDGHTCRVEGI